MKIILISGYYGFDNLGDELILSRIIRELSAVNPKIQITVLSGNPKKTVRQHATEAVYKYNPFAFIKALLNCDVLISGGGGLLQDITSKRSPVYYLATIYLAKLSGKKVFIWSQGIGPIASSFIQKLTARILTNADAITVRDGFSKQQLVNYGIDGQKIIITADPVFNTDISYFAKNKKTEKALLIGIAFKSLPNKHDFISTIAKISDGIIDRYHAKILFIPFHLNEDIAPIKKVKKLMNNNSEILSYSTIDSAVDAISSLDLLISMRYHATVIASLFGIKNIGISNDPKIEELMKLLGNPYFIKAKDFSEELLLKNIEILIKENPQIEKTDKINELKILSQKTISLIAPFL